MKKPLKYLALAAAVALTAGMADRHAFAQISLGVGVPDVEVDVGTREERFAEPYMYDGYHSGHWHARGEVHRARTWDARYRGYDCYEAFQYTYERGERVRYESKFCHDERDRPREVRETRMVVRVD